jgi:hypothetical protein
MADDGIVATSQPRVVVTAPPEESATPAPTTPSSITLSEVNLDWVNTNPDWTAFLPTPSTVPWSMGENSNLRDHSLSTPAQPRSNNSFDGFTFSNVALGPLNLGTVTLDDKGFSGLTPAPLGRGVARWNIGEDNAASWRWRW